MSNNNQQSRSPESIHLALTPLKVASLLIANVLIALFISIIFPGTSFLVRLVHSQCVGISIASCAIISANYFKTEKFSIKVAIIIASVIVGAVIGMALAIAAVQFFFPGAMPVPPAEKRSYFLRANLAFALLFGGVISYLFFSLQKMSDDKLKRLEMEKNAIATEIKLLQSQMEPHFLFNTLSNVIGLIDRDPVKARKMLESFTAFLRSSLLNSRNETVTLAEELEVVRNYLEIFRVRMGERLQYSIDIPPDLHSVRTPPLLIQPLVENAVKHGLEPSVSGGSLSITGAKDGDQVRISVADSGLGINELSPGTGISVKNIKKRLELVYNGRARLVFEENEPTGVKAVIEFPYETDTSHHS